MAVVPESEEAEQFIHLRVEAGAVQAAQASGQLQVFAAGEVRIEVRLFGHVADAMLEVLEVLVDVAAMEKDVAGVGLG